MSTTQSLPRILNSDFERVSRLARKLGRPLDQCPTCFAKPVEVADGVTGWENGTYRYRGDEHPCDCDTQKLLRKHYLLAGIGDQYMRLDWNDYRGEQHVRDIVAMYLEKWEGFKLNGMGVEFASPKLGVGKTFGATHIGKELIKRGESVYFIPFLEIITILTRQKDDWEHLEKVLYETTVLILDDVVPPDTAPQLALFHGKFEELIRNRTNFNRVTIMTTNLDEDELSETYPRPYSLLSAKQLRIDMGQGVDARQDHISKENLELVMNDEVRPIT